jgi:hypothetical protein
MKLFRRKTRKEKNIENMPRIAINKLGQFATQFNIPYHYVRSYYLDKLESLQLTKGIGYENIERSALVRTLAWLRDMEMEAPPVYCGSILKQVKKRRKIRKEPREVYTEELSK